MSLAAGSQTLSRSEPSVSSQVFEDLWCSAGLKDCGTLPLGADSCFLWPFLWHDISIVLIEVQSHEDS
jgi:hypothetical protein